MATLGSTSTIQTFQDVKNRLNTFRGWPADAPLTAERIAKAGFIYTGRGTEVECFVCKKKVTTWSETDQAIQRHQNLNPDCPFVKQRSRSHPAPTRPTTLISLSSGSSSSGSSDGDSLPPSPPRNFPPVLSGAWMNPGRPSLSPLERNALKREDVRLMTFEGRWQVAFARPADLAKAGFFCVGHDDQVQCAFCAGVIGHWESTDIPMDEHKRHFRACPFVSGRDVGNVPIEVTAESEIPVLNLPPSVPGGYDICERYIQTRGLPLTDSASSVVSQRSPVSTQPSIDSPGSLEALGINEHRGPEHPDKTTYESRLKTFSTWHFYDRQTPERLAEAGFFYLGDADKVKCFHCAMGLCNWESYDNPWVEHAKWFSRCIFVVQTKGERFIKQVLDDQKKKAAEATAERAKFLKDQLRKELEGEVAKAALEIVQDLRKVKQAITNRLRTTGSGYNTPDSLVIAALEIPDEPTTRGPAAVSSGAVGCDVPPEPRRLVGNPSADIEEPVMHMSGVEEPVGPVSGSGQRAGTDVTLSPMRVVTPEPFSIPAVAAVVEDNAVAVDEMPAPRRNAEAMEVEGVERAIEDRYKCKVCLDQRIVVIFLPCGHLASCSSCAPALAKCPLCRQVIRGTAKAFLP